MGAPGAVSPGMASVDMCSAADSAEMSSEIREPLTCETPPQKQVCEAPPLRPAICEGRSSAGGLVLPPPCKKPIARVLGPEDMPGMYGDGRILMPAEAVDERVQKDIDSLTRLWVSTAALCISRWRGRSFEEQSRAIQAARPAGVLMALVGGTASARQNLRDYSRFDSVSVVPSRVPHPQPLPEAEPVLQAASDASPWYTRLWPGFSIAR